MDPQDRHLLAVVAVWVIAVAILVDGSAVVLGLAVRLFFWAFGR